MFIRTKHLNNYAHKDNSTSSIQVCKYIQMILVVFLKYLLEIKKRTHLY